MDLDLRLLFCLIHSNGLIQVLKADQLLDFHDLHKNRHFLIRLDMSPILLWLQFPGERTHRFLRHYKVAQLLKVL